MRATAHVRDHLEEVALEHRRAAVDVGQQRHGQAVVLGERRVGRLTALRRITLPLILPGIITGLSLLMLFNAAGSSRTGVASVGSVTDRLEASGHLGIDAGGDHG